MNKQLQQILAKCTQPSIDGEFASPYVDQEKFSKLLIKECLLQVADVRIENDFEPIADAALVKVIIGINKHFGITA